MTMPRCLLVLLFALPVQGAVSIAVSDTVVAPRIGLGIGVNIGTVSACPVSDPSFEGSASNTDDQHKGLSQDGWPWYMSAGSSGDTAWTAAIITSPVATGTQAQRITINTAGLALVQGRADLATGVGTYPATGSSSFRVKAKVRTATGTGSVRIGFLNSGWGTLLPASSTSVDSSGWTEVSWVLSPGATQLRGVTLRFDTVGTYVIDDLVCWDENDYDSTLGMRRSVVERLKALKPATLRLGGLGVNGLTLEQYLAPRWPLSYGPTVGTPELGLDPFLALCAVVGADPFITVPPRFLDDATAPSATDLTPATITAHYAHHADLIDYIGGTSATTYGARRAAAGFPRWDTLFGRIYFELGNEVWGTPDGLWDMHFTGDTGLVWMTRYADYCLARMTAMRARPGWRSNMEVGFGGFTADAYIGTWDGSYTKTLWPAIDDVCDFGTIHMYYGKGDPGDTDAQVFGGLFGQAQWFQDHIAAMRALFATYGKPIETTVYEGAPVWGAWNELSGFRYDRQVSLGAAVSTLDGYLGANRAGATRINHFHAGPGGAWGILGGGDPNVRKPIFLAMEMFNTAVPAGASLVMANVSGAGTFDDAFGTGTTGNPDLAAYPYRTVGGYAVVVINRNLGAAQTATIAFPRNVATASLRALTAGSILANNESGETVLPITTTLAGNASASATLTVPAFSAAILTVADAVLPTIAAQPAGQSVNVGSTATFSVTPGGSPAFSYQWQSSPDGTAWSAIGGATGASYTTPATIIGDHGMRFRCVVANVIGSATSDPALLSVFAVPTAPTITIEPVPRSVTTGATAAFSVTAIGSPTLTYQWQSSPDGTAWRGIGGATASNYTTPATTLADNGRRFRCIVANGVGSDTSAGVLLAVADAPPAGGASSDGGGSGGGGCGLGGGGIALLGALSWLGLRFRRRA